MSILIDILAVIGFISLVFTAGMAVLFYLMGPDDGLGGTDPNHFPSHVDFDPDGAPPKEWR